MAFNQLFVLQIKFREPCGQIIKKNAGLATFKNKIISPNVRTLVSWPPWRHHTTPPSIPFSTAHTPIQRPLPTPVYRFLILPAFINAPLPISLCHLILIIIYLYSLPSFPLDLLYIVLLLFFQPLNLLHRYGLLTFRLAETKTFVCLMVLQCRYSLFCRAKPFVIQYLSDISFRAPLLKTPKSLRHHECFQVENENN